VAAVAAQSRVAERCASQVQAWDRSGSVNKSRAAESSASLAPAAAHNEYATDLITGRRRAQWARYVERLVFVDETWIRINMARYGGERRECFPALPGKSACLTFATEKRCYRYFMGRVSQLSALHPIATGSLGNMASKIFLRRRL